VVFCYSSPTELGQSETVKAAMDGDLPRSDQMTSLTMNFNHSPPTTIRENLKFEKRELAGIYWNRNFFDCPRPSEEEPALELLIENVRPTR
jgi:hypothetical protein